MTLSVRLGVLVLAMVLGAAPARASRGGLHDAIAQLVEHDAGLAAPVHATDWRTLDDRIAARELSVHSLLAGLAERFTADYQKNLADLLSGGAVRVDAQQPALARVHAALLRCLPRFGFSEASVELYMFGDLDVDAFAWGVPQGHDPALIGISSRVLRLYLQGDEGLKLSDLELEFILCRELAHIQAGHCVYQMLVMFAQSLEDKLSEQAKQLTHLLAARVHLKGLWSTVASQLLPPVERFIISLAFRRFVLWEVNADASADRAALVALELEHPHADALAAATRVLLLAMLKDYHAAALVDVPAFLAQVEKQTDVSELIRNPDRATADRALPQPCEPRGLADIGAHILAAIRRLLGLEPELPLHTAGYAEMIADLARYGHQAELHDVLAAMQSPDLIERGLLVLRRVSDLEDIRHIDRPVAGDGWLGDARARLIVALADALAEDLAAHGGDLDASRLGAWLAAVPGMSYQSQMAAERVLEELAARPAGLPAPASLRLADALIELREVNLIASTTYAGDLAAFLEKQGTPSDIRRAYVGYFRMRADALIAAEARALTAPDRRAVVVAWIRKHRDAAWPASAALAFEQLMAEVVAELRAAGDEEHAGQVQQLLQ